MNKVDIKTCISNFLYLWPFLREYNASTLLHFITSRVTRVHQNHVDVFIHLYTPDIPVNIVGINYRLFLDLICKIVVDYQDCKLIKREFSPGKNSEWHKHHLYLRFYGDPKSGKLLQGGSHQRLCPYRYRFEQRHDPHK